MLEALARVDDWRHRRPPSGLARFEARGSSALIALARELGRADERAAQMSWLGVAARELRTAIVEAGEAGAIEMSLRDALVERLSVVDRL